MQANDQITFSDKGLGKIGELSVFFDNFLFLSEFLHFESKAGSTINLLNKSISDHNCDFDFKYFININSKG